MRSPGCRWTSASWTSAACARARALPRVPRRSTPLCVLVVGIDVLVGAGLRRPSAETEEAARRLDVERLGRVGAVAAEGRERGVQDLVDDRLRQALDRLALPRVERAERRQAALDLAPADRLHPLAQRDDGGHDVEAREPAPEGLDLGVHDGLCLYGLARAGAPVLGAHALEVVDGVEVDVVELVHGRVGVARPGRVDAE